jgi:hypothetical protein
MQTNRRVKATLFILLIIQLVVGLNLIKNREYALAQPTALDMLLEVNGYTLEADLYTYVEYVALMEEIGIVPSDFILGEPPVTIILASYQRGDVYVWMEVHEFESGAQAQNEYDLQAVDTEYISGLGYQGNNGPLYQRFVPRERVFVHDKFLFLFFFSPLGSDEAYVALDDLLSSFISHILETIGTSASDPPSASVDAVWGVEPGDIITWHVEGATFTGTMGTGTSSSQEDWDGTWEIADVHGGHILVKQSSMIQYILTEDETRVRVDIPYERYTWYAAKEAGVSLLSDDGSTAGAVIFPLELNGVPLAELVYESISHLPENEITESAEYVTVHGRTAQYSGFTPIETSWKDMTVHRGTGIVTFSDYYYNNNEYSITTSTDIALTDTSFTLSNRVPVILSLSASMTLSESTIPLGTSLKLTVHLVDQDGEPVSDAEVTAILEDEEFVLSPKGSGDYEETLGTTNLQTGTYTVYIGAEKSGYPTATDSDSVEIQKAASPPPVPDPSPPEQNGIPGFPGLSIALGTAIATFVVSNLRRHKR